MASYQSEYHGTSPQLRTFTYNARGQLLTEGTVLGSTLSYQFDGNTLGSGLGVRTKAYQQTPPFEQSITQQDAFGRITKETTTHAVRNWHLPEKLRPRKQNSS